MNLYSRARKHIDMKRVKEIREEKIKKQKIDNLVERQLEIAAELKEIEKSIDWRSDLNEMMTTAGAGMINLPAKGDVDLVDLGNETPNTSIQPGATNSGGTYTFGPVADGYGFASTLSFFPNKVDLTKVDTLVFDFTAGDITDFDFVVDTPGNSSVYSLSISSGRKVITLKQSDRTKNATLSWTVDKNQGEAVGTNRISGVALQRRSPINLFVSLDDPEANAFIRMGDMNKLSAEERKKKLKDMLEAGNEYLSKYTNITPSKTSPGDIEIAGYGLRPDGTQGFNNPGDEIYDPATKKNYKLVPRKGYGYNQWVPVEKA